MPEIKIPQAAQQVIMQLQTFQQQLQSVLIQKETLEIQNSEIKRAIEELEKTKSNEDVFKVVGPILIKSSKEKLVPEFSEKKETIDLRLKALEKQEKMLGEKVDELQKKLQDIMTKGHKAE